VVSITRLAAGSLLIVSGLCTSPAEAAEGAASYYFAGGFGSFLTAVPPEPGFTAASQTLIFGCQAQRAVLRGRATFGLTAFALYEYLAAPTPSPSLSWGAACRSAPPRR
jgi:hypothetical protein